MRLDGGHDAKENRERLIQESNTDFLIKWNPRKESAEGWLERAEKQSDEESSDWEIEWQQPREGKRTALFSQTITEHCSQTSEQKQGGEEPYTLRRVIRITERTIDKRGQKLLIPDITLEGWWSTLNEAEQSNQAIINLYKDHATSEQFHSELKTDLDLERLPSGKFDTNDLVLTLGALTYNILRWIGLMGLTGELSPVRHPAKRRRIRTVMQELMYLAARVVESGHRLKLKFSSYCPGFEAYRLVYQQLAYG